MQVRKAEVRDLARIATIALRNRSALFRALTPDQVREKLGDPLSVVHVVEVDGNVVAFGIMDEKADPYRHFALEGTAKDPSFNARGAGRILNEAREIEARGRGISEIRGTIEATNQRSLKSFAASGYDILPEVDGERFRSIRKRIKPK